MQVKQVSKDALKPIEIQRDPCPLVRKTVSVFFTALALASFGAAVGSLFGFGIVGIAVGGIIGLVAAVALSIILNNKERLPLENYRIATLDQISKDQPQLAALVGKVKEVFLQREIVFKWGGEHHALHDYTTRITLSASMRERNGLKEVWKKFLENSGGLEVSYPKGPKHKLDFSMELERLEGNRIPLKAELLNPLAPTFQKDLEQLFKLREEAEGEGWTIEGNENDIGMRKRFSTKNPADECILVRREGSDEILGSLWYIFENNEKNKLHIACLARSAQAAQMQIGNILFAKLFETFATDRHEITLRVRSKNIPAVKLYENQFFESEFLEKGYYSSPEDNALLMSFNYEKYRAAQAARQAV